MAHITPMTSTSRKPDPHDDSVFEVDPSLRYICYKEEVGKGAFKTVYKAFDQMDGIEVAWNQVKIDDVMSSPPQELQRLYSEVDLLKSLKHMNILKFYHSWIDEDKKTLNIITELFTSGSLRQYCRKHKKIDIKAVKGWARQILSGLDYLHSQKPPIIHRDIKCDNIFINGNHGEVKIGDFGLATVMRQSSARSVLGTPGFVAPELYDEEYNELVDIYSFGMCILQMVTSEYPYSECENSAQIFKKVSTGVKPVALSKVTDADVKAFIEKCIAPASERLSARELLKDPFLRVSRPNGLKPGYLIPLSMSCRQKSMVSEDPHVVLDEMQPLLSNASNDMDADFVDRNPPIINMITSFTIGRFVSRAISIQKVVNGDEFILVAKRKDANSVIFRLHIARTKTHCLEPIDFIFHLDSDTSFSVAAKMAEDHEVSKDDVICISELVDLLLVNLVSGWKPYFAIDQLLILREKEICSCERDSSPTAASAVYDYWAGFPSPYALIHPSYDVDEFIRQHDIMPTANLEGSSVSRANDSIPVTSHFSSTSVDENKKQSSAMGQCSCTDKEGSAQEAPEDVGYAEYPCSGDIIDCEDGDAKLFVALPTVDKLSDHEQLQVENEMINLCHQETLELCYHEAFNYLLEKMSLAPSDAGNVLVNKKEKTTTP